MLSKTLPFLRATFLLLPFWLWLATHAAAQQTPNTPADTSDEVVRVNTELVQTDVVVLDKAGKFVEGLKPEQFELRVNGKPQLISFFERVTAGSINEDAQLAAARGGARATSLTKGNTSGAAARPLDRGRNVLFFVDDLHLSPASLARTRQLLLRFIDEQLGQNDQAVIATASSQLGFLQQLSDDKRVLRAAASRLSLRQINVRDFQRPAMTELQAMAIEQNDPNVLNYFVEAVLRETLNAGNQQSMRSMAETQVRQRATQIAQTSTTASTNTLYSLRNMLRTLAPLPGRKVVYFISDGFPFEMQRSNMGETLRRVTDAAVRAGVVVYTLDARGLTADVNGMADAASDAAPDPTGQLSAGSLGEATARQEPLRLIAEDTGGRALLNTNSLTDALTQAFKETSVYYLLAWRPESVEARGGKFRRLEVSVRDRADVTVHVQRGFYTTPPPEPTRAKEAGRGDDARDKDSGVKEASAAGKAQHKELMAALHSIYPKTALPTALALNYFNLPPRGMILTASIQVDLGTHAPSVTADGTGAAPVHPPAQQQIEIVGALYDERGEVKNAFQRTLAVTPNTATAASQATSAVAPNAAATVTPNAATAMAPNASAAADLNATPVPHGSGRLILSVHLPAQPGMYQVRIAARETLGGRTGSAAHWLEIPDIAKGKLALSSIFLGEQTKQGSVPAQGAPEDALPVNITVDRRLARTSRLRFFTYVYNALRAPVGGIPDVALQVQVFRDDQPVITSPLRKLGTEGMTDFSTLPYAAELSLAALVPGSYALQITVIDRVSKTTATERAKFIVE
ncbi:MAG TPA: VWA domain-containing protein [Pyrinomonadaceae bacterium]|nr:VWA domain-containing protein [Pyrinomonadaceae bacterium]